MAAIAVLTGSVLLAGVLWTSPTAVASTRAASFSETTVAARTPTSTVCLYVVHVR